MTAIIKWNWPNAEICLIKLCDMHVEHSYEVDVNWVKDRIGVLYSPELNDEVQVATPPQFPKGIDKIWSPEHLFTAAINSCLMTTFLSVAEGSKLEFHKFTSKAYGKLEMVDRKYMMSEITLAPSLTILREEDREKALKILHRSEALCLISNSIKSKIIFEPQIKVKDS
ncbi:MAG: OsmC family peroxiredoxin [Flavipsychrobacter sp.]|jgi:organic hydroperoxide reductase OsmC/OhrA|nr:OsmC family peroxiredoxin [Flavipsychrobacter sp.]